MTCSGAESIHQMMIHPDTSEIVSCCMEHGAITVFWVVNFGRRRLWKLLICDSNQQTWRFFIFATKVDAAWFESPKFIIFVSNHQIWKYMTRTTKIWGSWLQSLKLGIVWIANGCWNESWSSISEKKWQDLLCLANLLMLIFTRRRSCVNGVLADNR